MTAQTTDTLDPRLVRRTLTLYTYDSIDPSVVKVEAWPNGPYRLIVLDGFDMKDDDVKMDRLDLAVKFLKQHFDVRELSRWLQDIKE